MAALVLDLVRHGVATASAEGGDGSRRLTPAGEAAIGRLARGLAAGGWRPDRAFASPLKRARETAAILLAEVAVPPRLEVLAELAPDVEPAETIAALEAAGASGHVLVVAHLPLLDRLATRLAGETPGFHPGTLLRLDCGPGLGSHACRITLVLHPA